ncbi:MAG: alpha/beta fold hydrolase [Verrucomicrobia bacterium]|nr:alpha/beta fold hydrolase [Verrucomicrobiota bacterium]MBI3869576.1 alpha/beta fold hydrolase [Verrucomicrobiota bacterium]
MRILQQVRRVISWLVILAAMTRAAIGAEPGESAFLKRVYTNAAGARLPYRLLTPREMAPGREYPLLVFLHGAIARGDDNEEPLNWGPRLIQETLARQHRDCFVLAPQCPKGEGWTGSSFFSKDKDALTLTLELMQGPLAKEFRIDAKRRYLTGVSMGGIALWGYMAQTPGIFAAGVPVCAAGTPSMATDRAARFPIWAFHSDDDHLIPVQSARDMVEAWKKHGGSTRYTEYTGLKHSSWKKAYLDVEMFEWLFQQRLP